MKTLKRTFCFLIMVMILLSFSACGRTRETVHYTDAQSFEAALNDGENLEGKTVRFVALAMTPDSAFGYNIWAGEHLNFVSSEDPGVKEGDTVVVKTTSIQQVSGSWIIRYEKAEAAERHSTDAPRKGEGSRQVSGQTSGEGSPEMSGNTAKGDSTKAQKPEEEEEATDVCGQTVPDDSTAPWEESDAGSVPDSAEKPLELVDSGWCISSRSGDVVYVNICGMIYNPNKELIANFPSITATARHGDGSILATDEHVGSIIMPGDTITLCSLFSMPASGLTDDLQVTFDVDLSEWTSAASYYLAVKTTDFVITNVTGRSGKWESFVTGEITSHYPEEISKVNLSMILRKNGEIVYIANTFLDNLKPGKSKAFEFSRFKEWPEYDTIELSAMVW